MHRTHLTSMLAAISAAVASASAFAATVPQQPGADGAHRLAGHQRAQRVRQRRHVQPQVGGGVAPDIALAEAEQARAAALVDVERAKQAPDPSVRAGFRQLRETHSSAFVVGFSVPLPIWNRNSGGIAAARSEASRAEYEVKARERELARETAWPWLVVCAGLSAGRSSDGR